MSNKIELPAVKDDDLRVILDRFALSSRVDAGEMTCSNCNCHIGWENIGVMRVAGHQLLLFCDNHECIEVATMKDVRSFGVSDD